LLQPSGKADLADRHADIIADMVAGAGVKKGNVLASGAKIA